MDLPAAGQAADLVGRHVGAGEDGDHAGRLRRGFGVHALDQRVGVRRAQEPRVGLARQVDVVGVAAAAGQEPFVLDPLDGGADAGLAHRSILAWPLRRRGST